MRLWTFGILASFLWLSIALAEDQSKPIGPAEAAKKASKR
jgi:hypothetical protein